MAQQDQETFAHAVMSDFVTRQASTGSLTELSHKGARASDAKGITTGHPWFADLQLGESSHCDAVAMFIDLEKFTGRTFWDPPVDVVNLAHAVLGQMAEIVRSFGGYTLGLRGDGLFAAFGPNQQNPKIDAGLAMAAGAFALDTVQNSLNNLLRLSGIEPVQLRVGADFGRLDFVRCGIEEVSEINVIGFAANFAAKCEKYANSWEFVVGQTLFDLIPNAADWFKKHPESPKEYQRDYERRSYAFYDTAWRKILPYISNVGSQLGGESSDAIRTH
jgi:class 3 adenylate cyclase